MTTLIPVQNDNSLNNALSVASNSDFLPRIKLCQSQTKEVQKKIVSAAGNYCVVIGKDEVVDLGDEVVVVICHGRSKAIDTSGDQVLQYFDPDCPEFLDIRERSKDRDSGCMWGAEYLIYIPDLQIFATFFLNSPTARRETKSVHARLGNAALVSSTFIEGDKFSWFGPKCEPHTSPVELPEIEIIQSEINKYKAELPSRLKKAPTDDSENQEGDGRER